MKFIPNKAFPHPVLSTASQDYKDADFQAAFQWKDHKTLRVRCNLGDNSLRALVQSGKAGYAIEINCPWTFLRRIYKPKTQKSDFEIQFADGELHNRVELNAFVICNQRTGNFQSPNFNSEFGENATFDLMPGDVLAQQETRYFWWNLGHIRPIGTVFFLVESDEPKPGTFLVSWEEEKILIQMRKSEKSQFEAARKTREKKPTLLMSVYFPVLVETLRIMAEEADDHMEKKWFQAIRYKLDEKSIVLSESSDFLKHGQELLGLPLKNILPQIKE